MWDERYSDAEYAYGKIANDFLQQMVTRIPPGRVLCLAEGEGRNAVFLAQQGYDVVAVDASGVGLKKAQALANECGVKIQTIHADLKDFNIEPDAWQGIVSIFCHVPPAIRSQLHKQVVNGLVKGGVLILEAYTPAQLELGTGGPQVVDLTMSLDVLKTELAGLDIDYGIEMQRDVVEGKYHTGKGAVVQVVGIKQ